MKWPYDRVFETFSEFSREAVESIPSDLVHVIDNGNESFFEPLKGPQPETYSILLNECGRVRLYEKKIVSKSITAKQPVRYLHLFALDCPTGVLFAHIPVRVGGKGDRIVLEWLTALPSGMRAYYQNMDGMSKSTDGELTGLIDLDMPANTSSWARIEHYCENIGIDTGKTNDLIKQFGGDDLRVVVNGTQGDFVFVNLTKKDTKLYHANNRDIRNFHEIDNAPDVLDRYFANAIRGFPEPIDFR